MSETNITEVYPDNWDHSKEVLTMSETNRLREYRNSIMMQEENAEKAALEHSKVITSETVKKSRKATKIDSIEHKAGVGAGEISRKLAKIQSEAGDEVDATLSHELTPGKAIRRIESMVDIEQIRLFSGEDNRKSVQRKVEERIEFLEKA